MPEQDTAIPKDEPQLMVYGVSVQELCDDFALDLAVYNDTLGEATGLIAKAAALVTKGDALGAKVLVMDASARLAKSGALVEKVTGEMLALARLLNPSPAESVA